MISAVEGTGVDRDGRGSIRSGLPLVTSSGGVSLPIDDGRMLAWLHENGRVMAQEQRGDELLVDVRMSQRNWGRFRRFNQELALD